MSNLKLLAKSKPDVTLLEHLLYTLERALKLIDPNKDDMLNKAALIAAALHDIGKADERFQRYIRGKGSVEYHALLALPIVESILDLSNYIMDRYYKDLILLAIVSHHTPLTDNLYHTKNPNISIKEKDELNYIINMIFNKLGINSNININISCARPKQILISVKDRVFNDYKDKIRLREDFIYIQGILETADWLASDKSQLTELKFPSSLVDKNYDYQDIVKGIKGNIFIMLPTGAGKTETALYWAESNYNYPYRIFYILPTMTTINAMFKRLNNKFGHDVGEYHSNIDLFLDLESDNRYKDVIDDELQTYKYYFTPLNVTTPDQLILTLMNYKRFTLKSYSLYKSLIILDEIHAYDAETFGLIRFLIEHLHKYYNCKFCIMSATFPNKLESELLFLNAYKLVKDRVEEYYKSLRRTTIKYDDHTINDVIGDIIDSAKHNKTIVVVNTVKRAQDLYRRIKQECPFINMGLLHSRYIFKDRRDKEESLLNENKRPALLITTQLVEVSLDISYRYMYTEACYIDSLIQRCGRINRYNEYNATCVVNVLKPIAHHPYEKKLLDFAIKTIIDEQHSINNEWDYIRLTNKFYDHIWDDIRTDTYDRFNRIWEKCRYIYSIEMDDEEAQELLTTRSGILSIPAYPIRFRDNIIELQKKIYDSKFKRDKVKLRREQRQYLVNVPIINNFKDKLDRDENGFIFVNTEYDNELGLTELIDNII